MESVFRAEAEQRSLALRNVTVGESAGVFVVTAAVYADGGVSQEDIKQLRGEVEEVAGIPVRLEVFVVHADRLSAAPEEP